jgi:glycosyltransferase involved in cell wall biosynthesis
VFAVHLHGLVAALLGARALHSLGVGPRVYYSPHQIFDGRMRSAARLAGYALGMFGMQQPLRPIASNLAQARTLDCFGPGQTKVVEAEVAIPYFQVRKIEASRPLVVSLGRGQSVRDANRFVQLAVLLSSGHLDIGFQWLASGATQSDPKLAAAGIDQIRCASDGDLAAGLANAWIYAHAGRGEGHPLAVPSAMAVGLPCVLIDTPQHRTLVSHGVNGFLCRSHTDVLQFIALLVDHPTLRQQLGRAAREEAQRRFGAQRFRSSLLEAYDICLDDREALSTLTQT